MDQEKTDPQDGATLSQELVERQVEKREIACKSVYEAMVAALGTHGKLYGTNGKQADSVRFDLTTHSAFVGNRFVITRGLVTMPVLETSTVKVDMTGLPWLTDEERKLDPVKLFHDHYLSRPNGEERYMASNFPAKPCDEMTDDEITQGMQRAEARVRLEAWMLCAAIDGTLERYVRSRPGFDEGDWMWSDRALAADPSRNVVIKRAWWAGAHQETLGCDVSGNLWLGKRRVGQLHPDAMPDSAVRAVLASDSLLKALISLADAAFRMQMRYKTTELDPLITDANRVVEYVLTGKRRNA